MELPNNHYKDCVVEPIKVIKAMLTHEQFLGFLLGNVFKYRMRAGHKTEGDIEKALQYERWYKEEKTKTSNPVTVCELAQVKGEDMQNFCPVKFVRHKYALNHCENPMDVCKKGCPYLNFTVEQLVHKLGTSDN